MDLLIRADIDNRFFDKRLLLNIDYNISLFLMWLSMFDHRFDDCREIEWHVTLHPNVNKWCTHKWNSFVHYAPEMWPIWWFFHIYRNDHFDEELRHRPNARGDRWRRLNFVERRWKTATIRTNRLNHRILPKIRQMFSTFTDFRLFIRFFDFAFAFHLLNSEGKSFRSVHLDRSSVALTLRRSMVWIERDFHCKARYTRRHWNGTVEIEFIRHWLPFDKRDTDHSHPFEFDANRIDRSKDEYFVSSFSADGTMTIYLIATCTRKEIHIIGFECFQT